MRGKLAFESGSGPPKRQVVADEFDESKMVFPPEERKDETLEEQRSLE